MFNNFLLTPASTGHKIGRLGCGVVMNDTRTSIFLCLILLPQPHIKSNFHFSTDTWRTKPTPTAQDEKFTNNLRASNLWHQMFPQKHQKLRRLQSSKQLTEMFWDPSSCIPYVNPVVCASVKPSLRPLSRTFCQVFIAMIRARTGRIFSITWEAKTFEYHLQNGIQWFHVTKLECLELSVQPQTMLSKYARTAGLWTSCSAPQRNRSWNSAVEDEHLWRRSWTGEQLWNRRTTE